ncbi:MAG TPA: pyridoxal phosphate-dependent aminotransferase [Bacteroidota bacterium]|nr:pyridoxal phosphate-dependent aminotransferase [Bacteroidota bacterium]
MIHIAQRMKRLGTETAFEVLAKARALEAQGKNIIHLQIGEPDFDTPVNIRNAAKKALDDGFTHYSASAGLLQARQAIAKHVSETRGFKVNPDMVVITPGGKPIMNFVITACVDEGDEVIYPNPGYPIYESVIEFIGAKAVPLPLKEERGFAFELEDLRKLITPKTRMLILNSPQNPTGGLLGRDLLKGIAGLCIKHDLIVLSDEIYARIIYGNAEHVSIASFPGMPERTILLDGFSKIFSMTGWRLGYGIMNEELAKLVAKLQINVTSCAASFSQIAGIEALNGPQDDMVKMVAEFKKRRDFIVDGLNKLPGFRCHKPDGAFYVFPNIEGTGRKSKEFADMLLYEAGVACLSGTAFGKYGEGFLRFSYANSIPNIQEGLRRIEKALKGEPVTA